MSRRKNEPIHVIAKRKGPIKFSARESLSLEKRMARSSVWESSVKDYKEEYFDLREKVIDLNEEIERLREENTKYFKLIERLSTEK